MPTLTRQDDVFRLHLGDDENRFNPTWVGGVNAALDEVQAADGPRALVTTAGGKIWSNGLDLEWMGANVDELPAFIGEVQALLARFLLLDVPTVAAIQGHCFAAGAMLAVAHDARVMREDRGFFCVPEVDINIPFTPGMAALLQARWSKHTAHEAMLTGRRYDAAAAVSAQIVDAAVPLESVVTEAVARAAAQAGKLPATFAAIKQTMYADVAAVLLDPAGGLQVP
ncbi:Fatty acid oxidation complex subunit alpha [Paraconexibacter sp. AEG42_29]|uniref:Fatty acid oxidation complex subunit alpha n=1 Tax=Paraconexibacter sp. AEG42_29 TaxID=2997339 RepID=A0AAU7B215_9ACTN